MQNNIGNNSMATVLYRKDFQFLARQRLHEAQTLFEYRHFSGSYHFAGIAVECGLKACIARLTNNNQFPDKNHANKCFDHNLQRLAGVADLKRELEQEQNSNSKFNLYWSIVKDWDVDSRYRQIDEVTAKNMLDAITNKRNGVFRWIRKYW